MLSSSNLFYFLIHFAEYYGYYPNYQYTTPRSYFDYTGGLSEEEQLERAVLNSLNERGRTFIAFLSLEIWFILKGTQEGKQDAFLMTYFWAYLVILGRYGYKMIFFCKWYCLFYSLFKMIFCIIFNIEFEKEILQSF